MFFFLSFQSDNKKESFENTKNYTNHSLASVAYQINTLAYNILHMLELQTNQISEMESQLNYISQKFQFHNEKVARRKIALFTSAKAIGRKPKVLIPANNEKQGRYIRKPVDFNLLDGIGHGVKTSDNTQTLMRNLNNNTARMSGTQTLGPKSSMSSLSHYHHYNTLGGGSGPAPTTKPPTPPQAIRSGFGTLSRSSQNKEYRALVPPIAPPQVPKNYEQNYPIGHPKSNIVHRQTNSTGNYSTGHQNQAQYMPGMSYSHYHPGSNISNASINSNMTNQYGQSIVNHTMSGQHAENEPPPLTEDSLPDPPSPSNIQHNTNYGGRNTTGLFIRNIFLVILMIINLASPPLPPPPPMENSDMANQMGNKSTIYGTSSSRQNVPDWAPAKFIEKGIFLILKIFY